MKTNELVEVSQDREAWRELVVACVDRVTRENERERERERERESEVHLLKSQIFIDRIRQKKSEVGLTTVSEMTIMKNSLEIFFTPSIRWALTKTAQNQNGLREVKNGPHKRSKTAQV